MITLLVIAIGLSVYLILFRSGNNLNRQLDKVDRELARAERRMHNAVDRHLDSYYDVPDDDDLWTRLAVRADSQWQGNDRLSVAMRQVEESQARLRRIFGN